MMSRHVRALFAAAASCALPALCLAQAQQPAREIPDSLLEFYGGYGYFHPVNSGVGGFQYQDVYNANATASVTGFFNRYVGLQVEGSFFKGDGQFQPISPCPTGATASGCPVPQQRILTAEAGPVLRFPLGRFVPYIHALGGGERVNGPAFQPLTWGWGVTGGAGLDYVLPFLHNHLAVRPIQADFQYSQVLYGPLHVPANDVGGFGEIDALKLSAGLVVRVGEVTTPLPVMLGCTTEPSTVFAGDTVGVTGSTLGINPRRRVAYTWSSNGGHIVAAGQNATVDTTGLAPGDYTVLGRVDNGHKASQHASCTAPFTIRAVEPPTITCSASPASVPSGTPVDINTVATSPQNRPLTYSYSTTGGTVTGNGATASLNTDGLSPSTVTVTCNAVDDKGHTATTTTQVTIQTPPVPFVPQVQALCSVGFTNDARRPVRVDNEAKGCLDDIALAMNRQADARLIIIGNASPDEKPEASAERAMNIRQYLTQEKGIDPARIELRVGETSGRTARNILVPTGATFSDSGTQRFNEAAIVRHGQAYGHGAAGAAAAHTRRHPAHHPAAKAPVPASGKPTADGAATSTPH